MSLFRWSTPERRVGDRVLPIVPNEIYLHILEQIAPETEQPPPEALNTLTRLSLVCRFFANVCLPRIFERVEFSGAIFRDNTPLSRRNGATYRASRERTLCDQIAAKQPLALSLARCVKVCHFTNTELDGTGSWAVRIFVEKYLAGITHMKNIRHLRFSRSVVDMRHWEAMTTLELLEELYFDKCKFKTWPVDLEPEERTKIKVSHLHVRQCAGLRQLAAAIDSQFLRRLTTASEYEDVLDYIDWPPQPSLKEVELCDRGTLRTDERYMNILKKVPRTVEVLSFPIMPPELVRALSDKLIWDNWPFLRSLTVHLCLWLQDTVSSVEFIPHVLNSIQSCKSLQSFTISANPAAIDISVTQMLDILNRRKNMNGLKHLDIFGIVLQLVDGKWTDAS